MMGAAAGPSTRTPSCRVFSNHFPKCPTSAALRPICRCEPAHWQERYKADSASNCERQFLIIETRKIMRRRILHGVVVLKISLQHDFARSLSAPSASRNLSKQLKRALGGAKVRQCPEPCRLRRRQPASHHECRGLWRSFACRQANRVRLRSSA